MVSKSKFNIAWVQYSHSVKAQEDEGASIGADDSLKTCQSFMATKFNQCKWKKTNKERKKDMVLS
jgi:hypothetical protein